MAEIEPQLDELDLVLTGDISGSDNVDKTKVLDAINELEKKVNAILEKLRNAGVFIR